MTKEKPKAIRVNVPERFGSAYNEQWVERKLRIGRDTYKAIRAIGLDYFDDDKLMSEVAKHVASVIVDWNIEGDDGPLPEPWENSEAILTLADSHLELCAWVIFVSIAPVDALGETEKN